MVQSWTPLYKYHINPLSSWQPPVRTFCSARISAEQRTLLLENAPPPGLSKNSLQRILSNGDLLPASDELEKVFRSYIFRDRCESSASSAPSGAQLKLSIVKFLGADLYSGEDCALLLLAARIDPRHRVVEAAESEFKQLVSVACAPSFIETKLNWFSWASILITVYLMVDMHNNGYLLF